MTSRGGRASAGEDRVSVGGKGPWPPGKGFEGCGSDGKAATRRCKGPIERKPRAGGSKDGWREGKLCRESYDE